MKLFCVDYEYRRQQFRTVIEASDIETAERIFRRDNPTVTFLAIF